MSANAFRGVVVIVFLLFVFGIASCNVTVKPAAESSPAHAREASDA